TAERRWDPMLPESGCVGPVDHGALAPRLDGDISLEAKALPARRHRGDDSSQLERAVNDVAHLLELPYCQLSTGVMRDQELVAGLQLGGERRRKGAAAGKCLETARIDQGIDSPNQREAVTHGEPRLPAR